jgi:hypothetical protein
MRCGRLPMITDQVAAEYELGHFWKDSMISRFFLEAEISFWVRTASPTIDLSRQLHLR